MYRAASKDNDSDSSTEDSSAGTETKESNKKSSFDSAALGKVKIPADFPADVSLADYMIFQSVIRVKDDLMITFHAKDKSLTQVVGWFKAEMPKNGWSADQDSISEANAVLPFNKGDRSCGISITGFVLDASAQKDESTCGITIQTPANRN